MPLRYREYPPHSSLADSIDCYWSCKSHINDDASQEQWKLPDGCANLVFWEPKGRRTNARRSGMLLLTGPLRHPHRRPAIPGETLLGARFKPGALAALGVPADEWVDRIERLESVIGPSAVEWEKALSRSASITTGLRKLTLLLRESLCPFRVDPTMVRAAATIRAEKGQVPVTKLAAAAFLSSRQFHRRFQKAIGLNAKEFSRIVRLQALVREHFLDPTMTWANASSQGGFFDQSHLIHEFTRLSGSSLSEFREHLQHVRVEQFLPWRGQVVK